MAKKRGPKSKYDSAYHNKLVESLAELGLTDVEMSEKLGISRSTFSLWKKKHPKFLEVLKIGKKIADQKVVQSLYQRALGYSHPEIHISTDKGKVIKTNIIKHYPPDTTACIYWTKNRMPDEWRDKLNYEHSGSVNLMSDEAVEAIRDKLKERYSK